MEVEMEKKLKWFINDFGREMATKLLQYHAECRNLEPKKGKYENMLTDCSQSGGESMKAVASITKGVAAVVEPIGVLSKGLMNVGALTVGHFSGKKKFEKLGALSPIISMFIEFQQDAEGMIKWKNFIVEMAFKIFQSYEMQMMIVDKPNKFKEKYGAEAAIHVLAIDAVNRILNFAATAEWNGEVGELHIGVLYGRSKRKKVMTNKGFEVSIYGNSCRTTDLYDKEFGWVNWNESGSKYYKITTAKSNPEKFGFRRPFKTEKLKELESKSTLLKNLLTYEKFTQYPFILKTELSKDKQQSLVKDLENLDETLSEIRSRDHFNNRFDEVCDNLEEASTEILKIKNVSSEIRIDIIELRSEIKNDTSEIRNGTIENGNDISKILNYSTEMSNDIKTILKERREEPNDIKLTDFRKLLVEYYETDLRYINNYWKQFHVKGPLPDFWNQNIIIKEQDKNEEMFENFDKLFAKKAKRLIITADVGFGKSTLVHEMTRRWVTGEEEWTKKFSLLFLFRLSSITKKKPEFTKEQAQQSFITINDLLATFSPLNSKNAVHLLENNLKKCIFIFDGWDEFQHEFNHEIENILAGKLAHVVITSRPCKSFTKEVERVMWNNVCMELKGYTEFGVNKQLENFDINTENISKDLRDILKVPLFNTLYCITHKEDTHKKSVCMNKCMTIVQFVRVACDRYRKLNMNNMNKKFTKRTKHEILMMLGQAAQKKFSLMKDVKSPVEYPLDTEQHLSTAKDIGLILKKDAVEDFVFAHQTIAEYCAAYFWWKKSELKIENIDRFGNISFVVPEGGKIKHTELFSCFLSYNNEVYKQLLWQDFEDIVPLLNNYDGLPIRKLKGEKRLEKRLNLCSVPIPAQNTVMDKIEFSEYTTEAEPVELWNVNLQSGKMFEKVAKSEHLYLESCSLSISPEEFFLSSNIKHLRLINCSFNDWSPIGEEGKGVWNSCSDLYHLEILKCDFTVVKFLLYIMSQCTMLKTFKLGVLFENEMKMQQIENDRCFDYYGDSWLSELRSNQKLLQSIEYFMLYSDGPMDLTDIFTTFGKIVNLKKLELKVSRNLTNGEKKALSLACKNGWKELEEIKFDLKDEYGNLSWNDFKN